MMEGLLRFLVSPSGAYLRDMYNIIQDPIRTIIKVIPMVNPDGVIMGNYRTGMAGRDLNREFIKTDPSLYPTVKALIQLLN